MTLVFIIEFIKFGGADILSHLRMQYPLGYLLVLSLDFLDSQRSPPKIRSTSLVACGT